MDIASETEDFKAPKSQKAPSWHEHLLNSVWQPEPEKIRPQSQPNHLENPTELSLEQKVLIAGTVVGSTALLFASRGKIAGALDWLTPKVLGKAQRNQLTPELEPLEVILAELKTSSLATERMLASKQFNGPLNIENTIKAHSFEPTLSEAKIHLHPVSGRPLSKFEAEKVAYIDALETKTTPEFAEHGFLAPGIYRMSVEDFRTQFGGNKTRDKLMQNFDEVLRILRSADVKEAHVGGSFVSKKAEPQDLDFLWNKHEAHFNKRIISRHEKGILLEHDSLLLRFKGLQMLVDPEAGSTYKGMLYFMSHGPIKKLPHTIRSSDLPVRVRDIFDEVRAEMQIPVVPKGIIEIDLTKPPRRWLSEM